MNRQQRRTAAAMQRSPRKAAAGAFSTPVSAMRSHVNAVQAMRTATHRGFHDPAPVMIRTKAPRR